MHFGQLSVQYYIAGRAAAINQLIPVLGNLLHHAVEMSLKAALAATISITELKRLGHSLPKIWQRFKQVFPQVNGSGYDSTIEELHRFEELRYPDSILTRGALMDLALFREHVGTPDLGQLAVPRYILVLEDIDALQEMIFATAGLNPRFYVGSMSQGAKDYLLKHNRHAEKW